MYFLVYIPVQIPIEAIQLPQGSEAVLLDALPPEVKAELGHQLNDMMHSLEGKQSNQSNGSGPQGQPDPRDYLERCFDLPPNN